jgi:hypothetical protein
MYPLLHEYLVESRSLDLPGTGRLQMQSKPAVFDVANQRLEPPYTELRFEQQETGKNTMLASFLAQQLKLSAEQAQQVFDAFCGKLAADVREHGKLYWPHLGEFSRQDDGNISFTTMPAVSAINEAVPAIRVIRQGKTHTMVVGDRERTSTQMQEFLIEQAAYRPADRWWIPALVIGFTALVLILLRKMQYL